jgi:HKD family nuclease
MKGLYTNSNARKDFVINAFNQYLKSAENIYIASAFYTDHDVIKDLINSERQIKIIVRLGFPTSPKALRGLLDYSGVQARYFTSHSFHPKIYIFDGATAFVGSANLTRSALISNQEVMVEITNEDPRFDEIRIVFSEYWDQAQVLNLDAIEIYEKSYENYKKIQDDIEKSNNIILSKLGDVTPENIDHSKPNKSKHSLFIDSYSKAYQESVSAFKQVQEEYIKCGRRSDESLIPLRLEIDSFISYVRSIHVKGEDWRTPKIGWGNEEKSKVKNLIQQWLSAEYKYFDDTIVKVKYPLIIKVFSSIDAIKNASFDEIVDGLLVLHSFNDRLRFYSGGTPTLIAEFKEQNSLEQVKKSLSYLLYGKDDVVKRMANLIFNREYKLNSFGTANVQELIGWINNQDLPVINGRTTKILRYFGFDVKILS